jgi:hypothetical protein
MSQLGRISGPLLESNLLRDGIPLAFETDLLYFDVTNNRLGVNKIPSSYDLDIDGLTRTNNIIVDNAATIDNVIISAPSTFTTSVGPINIVPTQPNALITYGRMTSTNLYFNDNTIGSFLNSNVELRPNASGTTEFYSNTNITGDLTVQGVYPLGSISVTGNLGTVNNIIIGDSPVDVVIVNLDFPQSIIPGVDSFWSLGENTGDSSPRRWNEMRIVNETNISLYLPQAINVSDQMRLDGVINKISALQSNEDIVLLPDTGITYIERTKWQNDNITNLNNTALRFASTGIGYLKFDGTNGFILPTGTDAERPISPELGDTRWNTDQEYLECYDGTVYVVSTGGGISVTQELMEDLGNIYTLILG